MHYLQGVRITISHYMLKQIKGTLIWRKKLNKLWTIITYTIILTMTLTGLFYFNTRSYLSRASYIIRTKFKFFNLWLSTTKKTFPGPHILLEQNVMTLNTRSDLSRASNIIRTKFYDFHHKKWPFQSLTYY